MIWREAAVHSAVEAAALGCQVKLPVVIKADLRGRVARQRAAGLQIAQSSVAQPPVRDSPQLLLDRLEQLAPAGAGRHGEGDRELGGEPPDGAGDIHAGE